MEKRVRDERRLRHMKYFLAVILAAILASGCASAPPQKLHKKDKTSNRDEAARLRDLAFAEARKKNFVEALRIANESIKAAPDFSGGYWARARAYSYQGELDLGSRDAETAFRM